MTESRWTWWWRQLIFGRQYTDQILRILVSYPNLKQPHGERVHSQPYSCRQDIPCFTETASGVLVWIYWFQSTPTMFSPYIYSHINLHIASDVFALGFATSPFPRLRACCMSCPCDVLSLIATKYYVNNINYEAYHYAGVSFFILLFPAFFSTCFLR